MLNQKGLVLLIILLLGVFVISAGILGGSTLLKNRIPQAPSVSTKTDKVVAVFPNVSSPSASLTPAPKILLGSSQFEEVSIGDLINNPKNYYGKSVSITGRFTGKGQPAACSAFVSSDPPQFSEEYEPSLSWQIHRPEGTVAALFRGDDIKDPKQIPDYKYWQMINIKGVVISTTRTVCNTFYKSFYILTEPEYISIAEEPKEFTGVCGHFTIVPDKDPNFDRSDPIEAQAVRAFQASSKDGKFWTYEYANQDWDFKIETIPGEIIIKPHTTDKEFSVNVKKNECAKFEIKIPEASIYTPSR